MKQREQIASKSSAKAADLIADGKAQALAKLMKINDLAQQLLLEMSDKFGNGCVPSLAELAQIGQTLKTLTAVTRDLYSLPTETEKIGWERLKLERERLSTVRSAEYWRRFMMKKNESLIKEKIDPMDTLTRYRQLYNEAALLSAVADRTECYRRLCRIENMLARPGDSLMSQLVSDAWPMLNHYYICS